MTTFLSGQTAKLALKRVGISISLASPCLGTVPHLHPPPSRQFLTPPRSFFPSFHHHLLFLLFFLFSQTRSTRLVIPCAVAQSSSHGLAHLYRKLKWDHSHKQHFQWHLWSVFRLRYSPRHSLHRRGRFRQLVCCPLASRLHRSKSRVARPLFMPEPRCLSTSIYLFSLSLSFTV